MTEPYNPDAVIALEQRLMKLATRLEGDDAELVKQGVGCIVSMWAKLALVRRAVR